MPAWILAIDFGTSYTVAASKIGDRPPEVIEVGGERRVPSVIMVDKAANIVVGRTADDLSGTHPESTLRALKNRLGDQAPVVLDGHPYQVVNLVAALLRKVYTEAVQQMGEAPTEVRLTHPATWNRPRLNRLLEAAAKADLPNPALVPEPVAAALSFASEVGVKPGEHVVVYDLGGGTFDTAVVTSIGGGFNIVGRPSGDQNIGGELFDEIIVNHLGEQLPPDAWDAIQISEEPLWQQVGATLRNEARKAKETLSGNPYADLIVPLPTGLQQIRLTREEFEELVRPYLAETVVLLNRCVQEAGLAASDLAGISLVGGSSRSPIVERMVKEAFPDVPVIRRGDPKTAVASGAARAVRSSLSSGVAGGGPTTQEAAAGTAQQPVRLAPPVSRPPIVPGSAPAGARHISVPPSAPQPSLAGGPTSQPPRAPGGHSSAPPVAPGSPSYLGQSTTSYPPAPGGPASPAFAASATVKPKSKTPMLIGLLVIVAIVASGVVFLLTRSSDDTTTTQPTRQQLNEALLPLKDVHGAMGDEFHAEPISGSGDPFCPQFSQPEPSRSATQLFSTQTDSSSENFDYDFSVLLEDLSSFTSEALAKQYFEAETNISTSCKSFDSNINGVSYTYHIAADTKTAKAIGGANIIAVRYTYGPTTPSDGDIPSVGYIVEQRVGALVFGTQMETYRNDPSGDLSNFIDYSKAAFERAIAQL